MSEAMSGPGAERARRPDVRRSFSTAAAEDVATCRLGGAVRLLDDLATHVPLTPDEYRWYLMAWQATRVLAACPQDAAGWPAPRRAPATAVDDRAHLDSTTARGRGGESVG